VSRDWEGDIPKPSFVIVTLRALAAEVPQVQMS
jgi:hypothetical protein